MTHEDTETPRALTRIVVRPSGTLPDSFINQDWSKSSTSPVPCARGTSAARPCVAFPFDLAGDGAAEIMVGAAHLPPCLSAVAGRHMAPYRTL
jgi:hypothetical protein